MPRRRSPSTPDGAGGRADPAGPPRPGTPGERVAPFLAAALFGLALAAMSGLLGDDTRCRTVRTETPPDTVVETRTECPAPTLDNGFALACLLAAAAVYVPRYVLPEVLAAVRHLPKDSEIEAGADGLKAARQSGAAPGDDAIAQTEQAIGQLGQAAEPAAAPDREDGPGVTRR